MIIVMIDGERVDCHSVDSETQAVFIDFDTNGAPIHKPGLTTFTIHTLDDRYIVRNDRPTRTVADNGDIVYSWGTL